MTSSSYTDQISTLYGRTVFDRDGDKIGKVGQVYTDHTGQPTWASVNTGLFGLNESLVPLNGANIDGDRLQVAYDKATVKDAPNVDSNADEPLTSDEVEMLYRHYSLGWDSAGTEEYAGGYTAGTQHTRDSYETDARQTESYRSTESYQSDERGRSGSDDAMTRSEEQLNVGTERERAGVARLRKYVVTENVQTTVPVQREEVRLEREPITDANRGDALSGAEITESEHEVTLHAERPVVTKETVPVEQVRLGKETVTEQQTVGGEVRKERIEADLPNEQGRRHLD